MAKEKRTKPCSNCKKSKVKCLYNNSLPCERCVKSGQAVTCQFVPKLPSLKLPGIRPSNNNSPSSNKAAEDKALPSLKSFLGHTNGNIQQPQASSVMRPEAMYLMQPQESSESSWKSKIENRIDTFDDKLSDLVDILKTNQKLMLQNQTSEQQNSSLSQNAYSYSSHKQPNTPQRNIMPYPATQNSAIAHQQFQNRHFQTSSGNAKSNEPNLEEQALGPDKKKKRISVDKAGEGRSHLPEDFRRGFLSKVEAEVLFEYFNFNISQQLFGFDISKISVDNIWESSPILVCAICTISSMHHPEKSLSNKSTHLQNYLQSICGKLLYQGKPKNEVDGFNTIVALVLCSFWLSDSQMFTGLALQFAKEIGLNSPMKRSSEESHLSSKDKLKLWYLLYVLDGQQSMTFNRESLVNHADYSLTHSRQILLADNERKIENGDSTIGKSVVKPIPTSLNDTLLDERKQLEFEKYQRINDMRLVSQVEYNQALSEVFKGQAWDLISPSALGIPSKTNLELDKWMVSWTVLLSPGSVGTVWSSKSTLIYYNFAKMHINSSAIRQLETDAGYNSNILPKWNAPAIDSDSVHEVDDDDDDSDSSDEDDFISNKELLSEDKRVVDASIAINAARTILNLVLNDSDILNNLKYVPVHIHIMLYYAALLLINPPLESNNRSEGFNPKQYYSTVASNLVLVCKLQKQINMNLPTDKSFGERLIQTLDDVISEKILKIRGDLSGTLDGLDEGVRDSLRKQVDAIKIMRSTKSSLSGYEKIIPVQDVDSGKGKIFAWPGTDHGHP